jgi:hypothetical protein
VPLARGSGSYMLCDFKVPLARGNGFLYDVRFSKYHLRMVVVPTWSARRYVTVPFATVE